jgi:hypothetical protein
LQALGGWKRLHPSQRCAAFGLSWYETELWATLACAAAIFGPTPRIIAAPTAYVAKRPKKARREESCGSVAMNILYAI